MMRGMRGAAPRKVLRVIFAFLAAVAAPSFPSRAIDLPVREIILGDKPSSRFGDIDSFQSVFLSFETRYWDLYRLKSMHQSQDYHQSDLSVSGMRKCGRFLYGFEARRNSLTLAQDNVYAEADRLRGGRDLAQGNILFGIESGEGGILASSRATALASAGWGDGIEASLDGKLSWKDRFEAYVRARTFGSEIEVSEEINGYRFPFHFPLRTELVRGEGAAALGAFQVDAYGGWEVNRGEGDKVMGFENLVYFRGASLGGFACYRVVAAPGDGTLLRRLSPESRFPGVSLAFDHRREIGDIGMNRTDVRYLSLRDVKVYETEARMDFLPHRNLSCSAGWERFRARHSGDSFLDIWPFTIWDVFTSKRYRLGIVDERLDAWFLGLEAHAERRHFDAEFRARLDFVDSRGALQWLEREDILYPFFFIYSSHDEELVVQYKYLLQLDPVFSIHANRRVTITLAGSAMAPFGREKIPGRNLGPPSPPGPKEKITRHGGMFGALTIIYSY